MRFRLTAALMLGALVCSAQPTPDSQVIYKEVPGDDLILDVFLPEGWSTSDKRPGMVMFFGGGWVGGDTKQFYPHARFFADRGIVAISAQYRTRNSHDTDPFTTIADGKSAMRWVRSHAAELGIDPGRIIAVGRSAGGHVAASTVIIDGFDEPGEDTSVDPTPQVLVLLNPVVDTTENGYGVQKVGERKTEGSPVHHIREGLPPTLVMHGTADTVVPYENAVRFCDLMKEAGNRCELESYEGAGHGFFIIDVSQELHEETLRRAERFLTDLGYLPVD